jgi:RNA 3'-terminal phosphate cyclase (ATP)
VTSTLHLDGSILEGGGQLLRVAITLSAVTGKPIQVDKIRLKRQKPGLRNQHLSAIKAVAKLVEAKVTGLEVGSQSITFDPGPIISKDFRVDIGTAGSTTLVLQALLPALSLATSGVKVTLSGGTNNPLAPSTDYMERVLIPTLKLMGYDCRVELVRRGFYPRGGGEVRIISNPACNLKPLHLTEASDVQSIKILSYSCKLPSHITDRMAHTASEMLRRNNFESLETEIQSIQANDPNCSLDPGCGLVIVVQYGSGAVAGFDGLGERGKPAEKVAEEVTSDALRHLNSPSPIEPHLCDQLIVWMSLAPGLSELRTSELTLHSLTCMEIARKMVGVEFQVQGKLGDAATIRCNGSALHREVDASSTQGVI